MMWDTMKGRKESCPPSDTSNSRAGGKQAVLYRAVYLGL